MKFEEFTQSIIDEDLDLYINIKLGDLSESENSIGMVSTADGKFSLTFCDDNGTLIEKHQNLTEEVACKMAYDFAKRKKELGVPKDEESARMLRP